MSDSIVHRGHSGHGCMCRFCLNTKVGWGLCFFHVGRRYDRLLWGVLLCVTYVDLCNLCNFIVISAVNIFVDYGCVYVVVHIFFVLIYLLFMLLGVVLMSVVYVVLSNVVLFFSLSVACCVVM